MEINIVHNAMFEEKTLAIESNTEIPIIKEFINAHINDVISILRNFLLSKMYTTP